MPDGPTIALFSLAALGLLVIPGPAVIYIVTRSIDQGRTAGLVSVLGIHCGSLVHITAAVLGVSALLASSAIAFNAVRYVGAVYLIYLGIRRLRERDRAEPGDEREPRSLGSIFAQAVVVNVLNPKTALFFLAFLPQFVDRSGSVPVQMAFFGLLFVALGIVSDGAYALVASAVAGFARANDRALRLRRYVSGGMYLTLGVAAALSGSRASD